MPRSIPALINPDVLVWARQLLRYDIDNASCKIGIEPDVLNEWEAGTSNPSIPQLRKIGRTYNRPIAHFYLPFPPPSKMPKVRDHRLLPEGGVGYYTPELMKEFLNASSRRDIMIEMFQNVEETPKAFDRKMSIKLSIDKFANTIRTMLGITFEEQVSIKGNRIAFNFWREKIEALDILVFQVSTVPIYEMRGFSLYYKILPVIGLNRKDSYTARSFSLMHELTHILLHETGVCDVFNNDNDSIEVFCNRVAAETLVPNQYLTEDEDVMFASFNSFNDSQIQRLANRYCVSKEVIVRRFLSLNLIDETFYLQKRKQYSDEYKEISNSKRQSGFVPPAVNALSLSGKPFTNMVLNNLNKNKITSSDASAYLGVKVKHFNGIMERLWG